MKLTPFTLLALPLLAACSHHAEAPPPTATKAPEPAPIQVTTTTATEQPMPRYLRVTGQLKGSQEAMVAADATGKVIAAPVERGSIVKTGDVLIKLDDRAAALSLKEAEAAVASAQLKLDLSSDEMKRNEPLAASKAISDTDFQRLKNDRLSAEASLAAAVARRDSAKKSVDDASIRAPFSGTVAERLTELGEYVRADSQVVHLVALDKLHLWLNVPETAVGAIKPGQAVSFNVPAFPRETFTGAVKFIGSSVRETARDLIVQAEVSNTDGRLKPGMFAEGKLTLGEAPAVTVPQSALRVEGSVRKVLVVQDQRIQERLVEIGETKSEAIEIRRGITKGETIVTTPSAEATDGIKITQASSH